MVILVTGSVREVVREICELFIGEGGSLSRGLLVIIYIVL